MLHQKLHNQSMFMKAFFLLYLLLLPGTLYTSWQKIHSVDTIHLVILVCDALFDILALGALYSFSFKKRFFSTLIWKLIFIFCIGIFVADLYTLFIQSSLPGANQIELSAAILSLPIFWAIFRLGWLKKKDYKIIHTTEEDKSLFGSNKHNYTSFRVEEVREDEAKKPSFLKKTLGFFLFLTSILIAAAFNISVFFPLALFELPVYINFPVHKDTIMYTTVKPHRLLEGSGLINNVYSYYGVTFKAPWNLVAKVENTPLKALSFSPPIGRRDIFIEPPDDLPESLLKSYTFKQIQDGFNKIHAMRNIQILSKYDLVKTYETVNINMFSQATSEQEVKIIISLSVGKTAITAAPVDSSVIYSFETPVIRGFEFFNSAQFPKEHYLYFFDKSDQHHSIIIEGEDLPQNEIDAIISSITVP